MRPMFPARRHVAAHCPGMGARSHLAACVLAALTALAAMPVAAADADADAAGRTALRELDTVQAVATRAGQDDPQQAPGSVRTVTGEELERQRITRLEDLQQLAPGLDVASVNDFDSRVTLRGIGDGGGSEINIGMASSVGLFLDNVYLSRPGMMSGDLVDIDTAQVLSGPQGTLYGYNTTGGAIDIHTRAPGFEPEAALKQSFGQRGYTQTQAMVSGALGGAWAGRLNVSHTEKGGYVRNLHSGNDLGGSVRDGVRGQLLFAPDEDFSLRLIADWQSARSRPVYVLAGSHDIAGVDLFRQRVATVGASVVEGDQVNQDQESRTRTTQGGFSADAEWTLARGYRLRSVTSYRYFGFQPHSADQLDIPLYADSGADVRDRIWSQSLRLDSPRGERFDYALGLDYFGENLDTFAHDRYAAGNLITAWYGNTSNTGRFVQRWGRLNESVTSAFAQGTWHLSPRLDLTAGARVSYEEKTGSFRRVNKNDFDSGRLAQYNWLPAALVNLRYRVNEQLQAYASASYGEKSGGLNISSGAVARAGLDSLYLDPEHTRSAELGIKSNWLEHRLDFDAALFWTQISGFQTTAYDLESQSSYLVNAGKLRSRGVEASLALRPWQGLSLGLNATWLDASYLDFADARCPPEVALAVNAPATCDLTGEQVFRSPRLTYNVNARYEWSPRNGGNWFVAARYAYRDWSYGTVDNSRFTRIPAYGLLGVSAGYGREVGEHSWSATLWLDNATDRRYYRTLVAGDYGSAYGVLGEPRTVGASFEYRY